jgi:hypothetical protein
MVKRRCRCLVGCSCKCESDRFAFSGLSEAARPNK